MTSLTLDIPVDHPVFAGHFPNDPLVPGALLIEWIASALEQAFNTDIKAIKQIKFIAPVRPSDQIDLEITTKTDHYQIHAFKKDRLCIKGKFFYHA